MSTRDREKWDQRYREGAYADRPHPSALLAERLDELPRGRARGRALDIACGAGRNALAMAAAGYQVDAVDISAVGLARGRDAALARNLNTIRWIAADLDTPDWPDRLGGHPSYQLIVWIRYVNPQLMPALIGLLEDGGTLIVEQHLRTDTALPCGEIAGPASARHRVPQQQLLRSADGLQIVHYHEGVVRDPDQRPVALAQLIAQRRVGGAQQAPFDNTGAGPA